LGRGRGREGVKRRKSDEWWMRERRVKRERRKSDEGWKRERRVKRE